MLRTPSTSREDIEAASRSSICQRARSGNSSLTYREFDRDQIRARFGGIKLFEPITICPLVTLRNRGERYRSPDRKNSPRPLTSRPVLETSGRAGGTRTHGVRIMRSTPPCTMPASCTDGTDHRTDGIHHAGIITRAIPRTIPTPRRPGPSIPARLRLPDMSAWQLEEATPAIRRHCCTLLLHQDRYGRSAFGTGAKLEARYEI
jgi:hypothetical protein